MRRNILPLKAFFVTFDSKYLIDLSFICPSFWTCLSPWLDSKLWRKPKRTCLWLATSLGTLWNAEVTPGALTQLCSNSHRGVWAACSPVRLHHDLQPGCPHHNTLMAALSSPLLRPRGCLQRASAFSNLLHHSPVRAPVWRRNMSSVAPGVNRVLSQPPAAPQRPAARWSSSSSGDQSLTERLWSVYRETKRQTQGTDCIQNAAALTPSIHQDPKTAASPLLYTHSAVPDWSVVDAMLRFTHVLWTEHL